ncbi:MAG: SRPBCC domain-containing protein [Rhodoferax sp.]|nr:SRPBCC domain-containing protein [Rhodoferax sp.]
MSDTTHTRPNAAFRISRTVNAPLNMVWKAYTEQEPLMAWFGPKGFALPHSRYDFRPGGQFHYCLRTPTGFEMWGKWTFVDIVAPTALSMVITFSDAQGGLTRHPMSASWPLQTLSTTTFADLGGKTHITIEWEPHQSTPDEIFAFQSSHAAMAQGCNATFEQLDDYLAQLQRA